MQDILKIRKRNGVELGMDWTISWNPLFILKKNKTGTRPTEVIQPNFYPTETQAGYVHFVNP